MCVYLYNICSVYIDIAIMQYNDRQFNREIQRGQEFMHKMQ